MVLNFADIPIPANDRPEQKDQESIDQDAHIGGIVNIWMNVTNSS